MELVTWHTVSEALSQDSRFQDYDVTPDFLSYLSQELQSTMRALFGPTGPYYHAIPIFPDFLFIPNSAFQIMVEVVFLFRTEREWFIIDLTPSPDRNEELLDLYTRIHFTLDSQSLIPKPCLFFSSLLGGLTEQAHEAAKVMKWPVTTVESEATHVIFPPPLTSQSIKFEGDTSALPGFPPSTVGVTLQWLIDSAHQNEWLRESNYPAHVATADVAVTSSGQKAGLPRTSTSLDQSEMIAAPPVKIEKIEQEDMEGDTEMIEDEDRKRELALAVLPERAQWFNLDSINQIEIDSFPEYFDEKIRSKSPQLYKYLRNFVVKAWRQHPDEYLTFTSVRRCLACDVGSLNKIFNFLEFWNLINYKIIVPSLREPQGKPVVLEQDVKDGLKYSDENLEDFSEGLKYTESEILKIIPNHYSKAHKSWTSEEITSLLTALNKHGEDWEQVSQEVRRSQSECVEMFLTLPIEDKALMRDMLMKEESKTSRKPTQSDLIDLSKKLIDQVPSDLSKMIGQKVSELINDYNSLHNTRFDPNSPEISLVIGTSVSANVELKKEEDRLRQLVYKATELQMRRLETKLKAVEQGIVVLDQERAEVDRLRKQLIAERIEFKKRSLKSNQQ
ncbi:hypothetical protein RCL1_004085 [Eukaryota sp. TZLM3-RCL]